MIKLKRDNLLLSDAEALVNTVNAVGVMGKGVALQFRERFASNYQIYRIACEKGEVHLGKMLVTETGFLSGTKYIINFPTKQHWKGKSKIEFIEAGLNDLLRVIQENNIKSIAIPPLGCGNGGLNWNEVKPLIEKKLSQLSNVHVDLYEPGWITSTEATTFGEEKLTKPRALVLSLIYRYAVLGFEITHLEIQKLAYFLQIFGQRDLRLRYGKGTFGPYAPNLQHLLQKLEGTYLKGDIRVADAKPLDTLVALPHKKETVESFLNANLKEEEMLRLEKVENLIDGFESPFGLELLSTVFWVVNENNNDNLDFVINKVQSWNQRKRDLMKPEQIGRALHRVNVFAV
jgi:O-acetyl-ADP-ribose deacetylase (regulator of RNase III)